MEKQPARRMSHRHIMCDQVIIKLLIPHELIFYSERNLDTKMKKYVSTNKECEAYIYK
jgi:hypothetical protein